MDYDLNAETGSYTFTGIANGWDYDRQFNAEPASYIATGKFPVNIDGYVKGSFWSDSKLIGLNDFSGKVEGAIAYWKLEGQVGQDDYVVLPMQYWKATVWSYRETLPFGGTNYVEVMIPIASEYASDINDSYSFRIKRIYKLPNNTTFEQVFFNFGSYLSPPLPITKEFTAGVNQDSCLVKGAFRLLEEVDGFVGSTRTLAGVRSYTNGGGRKKVVCNLDPVIQPGMQVTVGNDTFTAKTITFYVSATDQYMEVHDVHV